MRQQRKPFTVEVRSSRRPIGSAPATSWGEMLDEPAPEGLPSRSVRDEATEAHLFDAARVFSAFATNAVTTATALSGLAASVFAPSKPEPAAVDDVNATEPRAEEPPRGRILPSLVPLNRFESESGPRAKPRHRKAVGAVNPEASPAEMQADLPVPETAADDQPSVHAASPRLVRRSKRVPAGERWKRRRLPKACW
jgi:hypothetical protein